MQTSNPTDPLPMEVVKSLLANSNAGNNEGVERRAECRHPLFVPVTLHPFAKLGKEHSAFTRELSCSGMGIVLGKQLHRGEIYDMRLEMGDQKLQKRVEIVWCRDVGCGWYQSGCRFVQASVEKDSSGFVE